MGCAFSKTTAAQVTQPATHSNSQGHLLDDSHGNHKTKQASHHLKVSILGASGLRVLDSAAGKSDIIVNVEIDGKADSRISTPVISGVSASVREAASATVDVSFTFEGELKGWAAGDKIVFTVKDSATGDLLLGRASVTPEAEQGTFEGELTLEDAGEGYSPILQAKVVREQLLVETVHEVTDAISAGVAVLSAEAGQLMGVEGARVQEVEEAVETIKDNVQGLLGDVATATDEAVGVVKTATHDVKQSIVEAYEEIKEVEETEGQVCSWC